MGHILPSGGAKSGLYAERLGTLEGRTDMIATRWGMRYLPDEPLAMLGVVASVIILIMLVVMMLAFANGFQYACLPLLLFAGLTAWVSYDYFNKLNAYKQGQANYGQRYKEHSND